MWAAGTIAGLIAAIVTVLVVPKVVRAAHWLGAVDHPDSRKDHSLSTPSLGGIAIFAGILAGGLVGALLLPQQSFERFTPRQVAAFEIALIAVFLLGCLDDIRPRSVRGKFAVQLLAAALLVWSGWSFDAIAVPFLGTVELGGLGPLLSLLWLVGITNAINLIDGIDGLASGVVAIIAGSFLVLAVIQGHGDTVVVTAAMAGACLGFLRHNWQPAKIFMGDSGSMTLGFLLAALSIHSSIKASAAVAIFVPVLALGLPAIDTLLVMGVRFLENPGHPVLRRVARMFEADRRHLHHLVLHLAPRRAKIVMGLYAIALAFCLAALMVALSRNDMLAVALLVVEVLVIVLIRQVGLRARARQVARAHREWARREAADYEGSALREAPALVPDKTAG